MSILRIMGFESGITGEMPGTGGTFSITSLAARTGRYGYRTNPTTTGIGYCAVRTVGADGSNTALNMATTYITFHFRYTTKPTSNYEQLLFLEQSSTFAQKAVVGLDSSGFLRVYDSANTLVGTGTTALEANKWYRIGFHTGTGTSTTYTLQINGVTELSGTINTSTQNIYSYYLGKYTNVNGNSVDYHFDDIVVSDSQLYGDFRVKALLPISNGSTMQWTSGTTTSDWTTIDETPISATDYVMNPAVASQTALFRYNTCANVGIHPSASIYCIQAVMRMRENVSGSSSNRVTVKSGATSSNGTAYTSHGTVSIFRFRPLELDPNTSSAWTQSAVDIVEAGSIEDTAVQMRMEGAYLEIMYQDIPVKYGNMLMMFQ